MIDINQNKMDRNNNRVSTRTSAVSDVVPLRRGRPRGRPRKSTEKSEEPVENNGSGFNGVGLTDLRKRGRPRHNEPSLGDITLRSAGRPPKSSSKDQMFHSNSSGQHDQCPSFLRAPFSEITNLRYTINHQGNIPENTPGRDNHHMDVSDASRESSSFARTPLSVMTNQKLSSSRRSNLGKENIIQTAESINNNEATN
ncbi:hypothetical protein ACET3Z_010786 [Daucus carota]